MAIFWLISLPIKKNWSKKYFNQGVEYFKAENDRQAILEFQKSNLLYKTSENYYYLGQLYFFNQNFGRSEYYYKKALDKDSSNSNAAYGLSELYLYQEKPEKALEVVEKQSKNEIISVALARIKLAQNEGEQAQELISDFNTDLAKFYQVKTALYNLDNLSELTNTLSLISTTDTKERSVLPKAPNEESLQIIKDAKEAIGKVSNPATKKVILAESLNQTGDAPVAVGILKKTEKENPTYRDAKVFLGHSYILIKNYEKAKEVLLAAKKIDPVYAPTWQYLAIVYKELGDEDSYKNCLEKCEKLK